MPPFSCDRQGFSASGKDPIHGFFWAEPPGRSLAFKLTCPEMSGFVRFSLKIAGRE